MFSQKTFLSGVGKSLFLFHSFHVLNKGTENEDLVY